MKYIYILTFCFFFNFSTGQNIQFSYSATVTSETERTLTFTAFSTGAAETIAAGTWRLYYNSAKTAYTSGDATPLGSDGGTALYTFSDVAGTNPSAPGADMYVDLNGFTFGGAKNVPDATPIPVFSIVMTNVSTDEDPDNDVFFVNTTDDAVVAYSGSGGSGIPISVSGPQQQSLPIVIRTFEATKLDKAVNLDWTTSSEINGSHFEVERSQDLSSWINIGNVNAIGESNTIQEYSFLDDNLPLNARSDKKIFYYRLNMVDNDGASEYSEVRSARFDLDGQGDFLVYPNPSINEVYVNLSSITTESGPVNMNIINMNGQLVKQVKLTSSDDIRVDVSDLIAGVYYFIANQGEETFTQKVIKVD